MGLGSLEVACCCGSSWYMGPDADGTVSGVAVVSGAAVGADGGAVC